MLKEVITRFSQHHAVPMHNSTAEDGKQNHTLGLVVPRNQDSDETDLEVAEIIASTASNSPASRPENGKTSLDNLFDASDKPIEVNVYKQDDSTIPAANTFTAIQSSDEWLKRYLLDGHNSQLGNVPNKVEVTTEDGEEWYRVRISHLHRFYNTEIYLVGKQNNYIYTLRGEEKEVVCMKTLWTPYNLVALEELLRNNQYLRLKGIKSFEEEGKTILNKLVSIEVSWPENQGILFFYISKTLEMIWISFMASLLNAVL